MNHTSSETPRWLVLTPEQRDHLEQDVTVRGRRGAVLVEGPVDHVSEHGEVTIGHGRDGVVVTGPVEVWERDVPQLESASTETATLEHDEQARQEARQPLVDALYEVWQYAGELESEVARCEPAHLEVSAESVYERLLKMLPNLGREFIDRERAERAARVGARR